MNPFDLLLLVSVVTLAGILIIRYYIPSMYPNREIIENDTRKK